MRAFVLILYILAAVPSLSLRQTDSLGRVRIAERYNAGDKEGVLEACRDLVQIHKEQGNEKELFNAYATYLDQLQVMGRFDEAMSVLQQMSSDAEGSDIGAAVTEFCFGQFYLGNRQPAEAGPHYRRAFRQLQALGEDSRALRAGFNLQAVAMNLNTPEEGLAINDSTQILLDQIEKTSGKPQNANRFKQIRYRFVLMQRLGRMKEAAALKDSLLHYHAMIGERSQDELVYTAVAQYEQAVGNKQAAYALLDTLIERNLQLGNYLKVAQFRQSLADFQSDNGDLRQAVENYRLYAAENDSAQVHRTNEQLNALTKQFQLQELELENKVARQHNAVLSLAVVLLAALLSGSLLHARTLRRKNRALYQSSLETIQAEKAAAQALTKESAAHELSADEKIYAGLLTLMQDEELFKDPELSRDALAARLGTNRTYLADAVRNCANQTIGDFINHYRLRWAAETLASGTSLSVTAVGEDAGFASRSTFNRLFQQQYGMSPSAFRAASSSRSTTGRAA